MTKWIVRIWKSEPDPLDGFYCEMGVYLKSSKHTIFVSEDSNWFPTVALCELWAKDRGEIEYKSRARESVPNWKHASIVSESFQAQPAMSSLNKRALQVRDTLKRRRRC